MTIKEALQSMVEYENDNLLVKALLDRGVSTTTATYTAAHQQSVELAAADVYLALATHPDLKEGSRFVKYSNGALMAIRRTLLKKHGQTSDTITTPGIALNTTTQVW